MSQNDKRKKMVLAAALSGLMSAGTVLTPSVAIADNHQEAGKKVEKMKKNAEQKDEAKKKGHKDGCQNGCDGKHKKTGKAKKKGEKSGCGENCADHG